MGGGVCVGVCAEKKKERTVIRLFSKKKNQTLRHKIKKHVSKIREKEERIRSSTCLNLVTNLDLLRTYDAAKDTVLQSLRECKPSH